MACVNGSLDIGCFGNCAAIEFPYVATQTGTHTVKYVYLGQINTQDFEGTTGQALSVPNIFADYGVSTFSVKNPDGSDYIVTVDNYDYKEFKIKINPENK